MQYDIRSRIRAQIRLVKRQFELAKTNRTPSPHKSPTRETKVCHDSNDRNIKFDLDLTRFFFYPQKSSFSQITQSSSSRTETQSLSIDRRDTAKRRLFDDDKSTSKTETKTYVTNTKIEHHEKPSRNDSTVKISGKYRFF